MPKREPNKRYTRELKEQSRDFYSDIQTMIALNNLLKYGNYK